MCGLEDSGILMSALAFSVLQYTVLVEVYLVGASHSSVIGKGITFIAVSDNC